MKHIIEIGNATNPSAVVATAVNLGLIHVKELLFELVTESDDVNEKFIEPLMSAHPEIFTVVIEIPV